MSEGFDREKTLRELDAFNSMIRGFCEKLDCGDLSCGECPLGADICVVLGNDNLEKKYGRRMNLSTFISNAKDVLIIVLIVLLIIAWT